MAGTRKIAAILEAGIPVAGGHSIDCPEPVYGLAVVGTCRPDNIRRNVGAKIGDAIILTKPLGVGVYSAAFKKDMLSPENYAEMVATMTKLNRVGAAVASNVNVHAMTDVTGFGLLGHALEMAQGSGATMMLEFGSLPFLQDAANLAQRGCVTGASNRNWASYGASVVLPPDCSDWRRDLLTDPQTSGGLLVACSPDRADELCKSIVAEGYPSARVIGRMVEGPAAVRVEG